MFRLHRKPFLPAFLFRLSHAINRSNSEIAPAACRAFKCSDRGWRAQFLVAMFSNLLKGRHVRLSVGARKGTASVRGVNQGRLVASTFIVARKGALYLCSASVSMFMVNEIREIGRAHV